MNETLVPALRKLRLSGLAQSLEVRLQEAGANRLSHLEFLELILQDELHVRDERQLARRIKAAEFRDLKTLDGFDFSFNPSFNRKQIYELATGKFIRQARDVLLLGPSGVGKSHLAEAIGYEAIKMGFTVYYRSIFDVVGDMKQQEALAGSRKYLRSYLKPDLLIIDDMGIKKLPALSGEYLFEVVMRRHENRSTIMTSNRPIEKRLGKLTNPAIGMWSCMIALLLWAGSSHMEFISSLGGVLTLGCAVLGAMWVSRRLRRAGGRRRRNLYRRLPRFTRSLLAAQLAIQLGMIIPLSGSYFGHFSVAGVLVNLFAIPLIGIFVQASVLAGVLGMVPVAGAWLAWIPEQVTTLSGLAFFEVAHRGASIFSYPEVPGFSATGLAAYYAALFALFHYRGVGQRAVMLYHRFLDFARVARYTPIATKTS